jgi:lipoprotein-anchoring transpeptidase ErfK/SrfK
MKQLLDAPSPSPSPPGRRALPIKWIVVTAVAVLVIAAVGAGLVLRSAGNDSAAGILAGGKKGAAAQPPAPPVRLAISPSDKAAKVRLDAKVKVRVTSGTIRSVKVTGDGKTVPGKADASGETWTSTAALAPGTRYKLSVVAVDAAGQATTKTSTFSTLTPARELETSVMPLDGETVGVGMPIAVFFNEPVKDRAAVERKLEVTSTHDVNGAWHWRNDEEVRWRPEKYWSAGEKVNLKVNLAGVNAGNGTWGVKGRSISFKIGDAHISTVNVNAHKMVVTSNGKAVKTFPSSTGRDKYPTTNGIHTVLGMERSRIMDSATVDGIPSSEAYRLKVEYATRISNTGEFVHAAPWSVGSQGSANVSHGCVNLSTGNAAWFYQFSRRGDIVKVVGSPRKPGDTEGLVEWNQSWASWKKGSAL